MTVKQKADASKGVGTSKRTTKLKARSYGKKAVNFLLTLVMVISLCFSSGLTALADGVNDTAADQGIATQAEENTEATHAEEAIDATTPGEGVGEEAVGSEEAAEQEQPDADVAAVAAAAAIAPMSEEGEGGISTQATGVQFTKLELHEDSPSGTLVADLLNTTSVNWDVEHEYYLVAEVTKDAAADDCWVAIDMPYWMTPINMVGGVNWNVPAERDPNYHTTLDQTISFTPATGGSTIVNTGAGKVYYHIKTPDVQTAGFQISMKPSSHYYSGSGSQTVTTESLGFSCGDMNGLVPGDVSQTVSEQITKTSTNYNSLTNWKNPTKVTPPNVIASVQAEDAPGCLGGPVITHAEFDVVYPKNATLNRVQIGGVTGVASGAPTIEGNNAVQHFKFDSATGFGFSTMFTEVTWPDEYNETTQAVSLRDASNIVTWGDEHAYERAYSGVSHINYYEITTTCTITLAPVTLNQWDWQYEDGIENNQLINYIALRTSGTGDLSAPAQTVSATIPSNAVVRAMSVPLYADHGTTIIVNGVEYTLADVMTDNGSFGFITADALGVSNIESVEFDIGEMKGGSSTDSVAQDNQSFPGLKMFAFYGSVTDGNVAVIDASTKNTEDGEGQQTAQLTTNPASTRNAAAYFRENKYSSSVKAGGSVDLGFYFQSTNYVPSDSQMIENPSFYVVLPEGFNYANASIGGTAVTGTDITASATGLPAGTKVYQFDCPTETEIGVYPLDNVVKGLQFNYTLLVDKSANADTYSLSDFTYVGSKDFPAHLSAYTWQHGTAVSDTYGINDGYNLLKSLVPDLTVQELKEVTVENSMTVTSNGTPLNSELVYNQADPNGTRAFVKTGFTADYKVHVQNQTGENAKNLEVFIPVPKTGQNFGTAFNPDGAQEFNLVMTADSIPTGWQVQYLKMNGGSTFTPGNAPESTDYSPALGPDDADMIRIVGPSELADEAGADFVFKVTGDSNALGAINLWNCVPRYVLGTTTFTPDGSPEALEMAQGVITGRVYDDVNGNGVQDTGENGIPSVTVTSTDNFKLNGVDYPRTLIAVTNSNGDYTFDYVRNTSETGKNASIEVGIVVTNPDLHKVFTSHEEGSGNKPSIVTAAADQATASYTGIQLTTGATSKQVDAGLTQLIVKYLGGDHPSTTSGVDWTIDEHSTDVQFGQTWPAYAGPVDTATTNSKNVGNPAAALGYHFDSWSPAVTGTVDGSKDFTAQWALNDYQVSYAAGANGSVSGGPETVTYNDNPTATGVTKTPAAGYEFEKWEYVITKDDGTTTTGETTDPTSVTILGDTVFTAKFKEQSGSVVKTLKSVTNGGQVGGVATYEVTVTNLGTAELNGYKVTEAPEGLTITGVTGTDVAWDAGTKTITFNKVAASNGTKTATVVCKIDAVPFTNSVEPEVKIGDYDITKTRVTDKTGATAATATDFIYPGDTVYYKLELTNGATAIAAAGIDITDTATNLSDGKYAADDSAFSGTWNTGAVAANGSASVVVKYTANTGVDYVSNAAVAPNGKNSIVTDSVQRIDKLEIDKKLDTTAAVGVGDEVQYTITVKNDGTNAVNGAKITEQPVGLTITSVTGTGVTWVDPDITIASIAAGGTATVTVKATVTATSFANGIVNPGPDPTKGLTLDKIRCDATGAAATDKIMAGDTVYYKLSIENTGDTTIAAGKEVTDTFSGLTYVGTGGTVSGTVEADGSKWTAPAVNVGDTASVILKFTVKDDAKLATNTAKCDGQIKVVTDKVIGDEQKDVTVTKTLTTTGTIEIGDTVSYTITAKNNGTNNLTSVVLDEQPVGLTNLAITTPTTGVSFANNQITIDKLDAGATATITLTADVTAEIFTNGLVNPISDFTLDKARTDADGNATANTVAEGDTVYYLISITNTGDVVLPAKTVTDTLSGLTFVSAAGDGTMSADGTTWTTPADLAIGATASTLVTATVTAESGSIITNTATCEGQTKVVSDIVSIYDVNAEGFGMTSATAIAIFGNSTDPMDLAGASYNNVSATTDGNPATGFSQVIDPADWAAIQAGTPGTYYVTYSNDDNLAGTTTITVPIVIGNDIENGDYRVSAQDVTLSSTAAKLALGSSTDTMDLAAAAYNNAAAETKTNGVWAPTTNISNSVDPADWTAIKAGTKGDYPVAYYNDDDATGVTKYVALVSIGNTPASEYKVDATSITLTPDAAILAFGTSTDPTDLMGPLYNKVSAQTFDGVAWNDTTNISQVIDPADWAAIQAGTPGTYYVTYVNDDDPSGNTKKVVSVVVDEWGILDTGITAHNFDYATGISSPTITDAIARQLADAAGYDDNGVPIAANQIIPDVAQLAAINAAKDAGLTGSYPLALVNSVTGEVANIVVTLTGEPKITLTKTVSTDKAAPGDTVVYTITASNDSEVLATGVWTKDIVPENTTFVSCDALGSHESANGQEYVSWFATEIEPGDSITYTMKVTVNECQDGTGVKNIALYEVTGSDTEPTDLSGTPTGGVSNEVEFTVNSSAAYAKTSKLAKTGDDMSLMVIALGFASLVCAAGALGLRRRRQY